MSKLTISVNQQLDLCGDEFLNDRDFDIDLYLPAGDSDYIKCTIDGKENCFIEKRVLKAVLTAIEIYG